jgi:drug/metabolite transporter (DMT)-like permease
LFINREEFLKISKVIPSLILLGIINAALPFFLFAWSAQELTAGMLSILNGTSPLFALIIAILLFRQNTTFLQIIGLLAGFIGLIIFIGLDEIRVVFFPVTLCLIGAFCYAYSNNVLFKLNHINSSALASATMLSGFVFSIPLFLSEPQSFSFDLSLKTLLQRSSPVQASSIIFLVPITGIFWGAIFLNENIDQKVILGSLCILIGIGLTNIFKPKKLLRD